MNEEVWAIVANGMMDVMWIMVVVLGGGLLMLFTGFYIITTLMDWVVEQNLVIQAVVITFVAFVVIGSILCLPYFFRFCML